LSIVRFQFSVAGFRFSDFAKATSDKSVFGFDNGSIAGRVRAPARPGSSARQRAPQMSPEYRALGS